MWWQRLPRDHLWSLLGHPGSLLAQEEYLQLVILSDPKYIIFQQYSKASRGIDIDRGRLEVSVIIIITSARCLQCALWPGDTDDPETEREGLRERKREGEGLWWPEECRTPPTSHALARSDQSVDVLLDYQPHHLNISSLLTLPSPISFFPSFNKTYPNSKPVKNFIR